MAAHLAASFSERLVAIGGETGRLIATRDWAATSLRPIDGWPQSLRTAVSTLLMSPVPIVMLWGEDGVMLYNDAYSVFAGGRHPELLGSKVREGWPEVADFNDSVMKVGLAGGTLTYRDRELTLYRHGRPEQVFMNLDYSPVLDDSGEPAGVLAIVVETTERVAAERRIRDSNERLRAFVTASSTSMYRMSPDWSEMRQLDGRGFLSDTVSPSTDWLQAYIHPDDQPHVTVAIQRAITGKRTFELEHRVRLADGGFGWTHSRAVPIFDESGEIVEWFGSAWDVTERKRDEEARRASEARLAAIFASATVGLSEVDLDGRFLHVNEELCRLMGRGRDDLLRLSIADVTNPDDMPASLAALERAVTTGQTTLLDKRYNRPDGRTVWANSRVTRLHDTDNGLGKLLVVTVDLTERMAAEKRVRESEARFRKMLEIGSISVVFFDMAGGIVDANDAFLDMVGYTRTELAAGVVRYEKLTPPDWRWRDEQTIAELQATGESVPFEKQYTRKDGSLIWIHCSGKMLDERTAVEFIVDVTERKRAEERLRATEEFNHRILASSADCIKVLDLDGCLEFMSDGGMCVMEVDDFGAIEGACWPDMWKGDERAKALAAVDEARRGGTGRFQGFATTMKGRPRWWDVIVTSINGPDGSPEKLLSVSRDVTATREAEERVREGEARYRQIVEGAEDFAIVALDEHGIIMSWNTGAERTVGYSEQEAVGQPGAIFFTPEDRAAGAPDNELHRARTDGRAVNERWHLKKDGSQFWGSGLTMRLDQQGGGYLKLFRDRTAEHEAEAALRESEAALAAEVEALGRLQDVSTRLVADEAPQTLYDAILAAAADLMGSECASLQMLDASGDLQLLAHRGYDPRSAEYWQTVDASSQSTCGISLTQGKRVVVPDVEDSGLVDDSGDLQSYRWTGMRAVQTTPLLSRSGRPLGMLSTHWKRQHTPSERDLKLFDVLARQAADAIERTTAQAELRESEARQAFLLSLADALRALRTPTEIASIVAERLGERFELSRVFYAEYFGSLMRVQHDYTNGVDSIVGEHDLEAFGPELLRAYHKCPIIKVEDVRTDPRLNETARSGLLGRQVGAYLDVLLFEEEQWVSLLALQSATPRTWTPAEESLFREVGERVKIAIERARAEDRLRELNETLEAQVAERTEALRRYHDIIDATVAPICAFDADYRLVAFNRAHNHEFRRVNGFDTKIGDVFPDLFIPEQGAKMRAFMTRALSGERFTVTEAFGRPELGTPSWEITYTPLLDHAGRVVGAFHHAIDISERLVTQAELEVAQEALRQSQKMEAMGQLTGGVAHDFNNLLTPIVGALDMLQRKELGGEREQRLVAGAAQSAERAKTLVQRLLAFARRQPLQAVPVDIAALVRGMGDLVSSTTGPQIRVLVEAPNGLPPAKADPNQLEMALLNLSVNARDAMPDNGTLRISASAETVGPGHRSKLRPGAYIRLSVADTGSGMDQATLARAVEPFFSTKGVGKGTGLGLSMVHGLASQLGGALTIQSRPGLGTNVELWLPVSQLVPEPPEAVLDNVPLTAVRGTALLVDDEELVRMSTADMLSELGYAVIEAASAEEAIKLVDQGKCFDLLVTDHLMPGMNGTDLARAIRTGRPRIPVLLVSGYAEREGIEANLSRLTKPFRKDELARSLAQLTKLS